MSESLSVLFTVEGLLALLTLGALEIVLGIDNIVFISILTGKLPEVERPRVRRAGLLGAMVLRIALLFAITWVMGLTATLFTLPLVGQEVSGRDLILLAGGLFLIAKATFEIHERVEGHSPQSVAGAAGRAGRLTPRAVLVQILLLDIVFSLDSVITAVGMAKSLAVMVAAVVAAVGVMLAFAGAVADFVERHPPIKMLALAFLLLVGFVLVLDGLHQHVPKGSIYFAMAFSLGVELLNLRAARRVASRRAG